MGHEDQHALIASIAVKAPADDAFAFMSDGMKQTMWALGSWDRRDERDGLYSGVSLFDGNRLYIRLEPNAALRLVDYRVGPEPDALRRLVQSRVVDDAELGRDTGGCVVTLIAWRGAQMTDEVWTRTQHAFRTEVHLIRARIEGLL